MGLAQQLLGTAAGESQKLAKQALELYAANGSGFETALRSATAAMTECAGEETVLPQISPEIRDKVLLQLAQYEELGAGCIDRGLASLPSLRKRLRAPQGVALLAGIRHRLELVAGLAANKDRTNKERERSAAAILYLDELQDVIPDDLGYVGLLDDDFALRIVLDEVGAHEPLEVMHWAERISALWDDLPFLQGVRLSRGQGPVATTWLDRINSYLCYRHALEGGDEPLVLVQPSIACSPLHPTAALAGLLVLEALTASRSSIRLLQTGQVYEIDGKHHARYAGVLNRPNAVGWLRLEFRDATVYRPPVWAHRMVAVPDQRLSTSKRFPNRYAGDDAEPVQRFFAWDDAIGASAIKSRILLVTSQQRAEELFRDVHSNDVHLLDQGLVRFAGMTPTEDTLAGALVLIVPTLGVARELVEQGLPVLAIVVDGFERFARGRHDVPFIQMQEPSPAIIVWSATGYYPERPAGSIPEHRPLHVAAGDLSYILELDGELDDTMAPGRASLWEAATSAGVEKIISPWTSEEEQILTRIDDFTRTLRTSEDLPDYWKYHLFSGATTLRSLVTATPAYWSDIKEFAQDWDVRFQEEWDGFRTDITANFAPLREAHREILAAVLHVREQFNSKASSLLGFLQGKEGEAWRLVCDRADQLRVAVRFVETTQSTQCLPVLLKDLEVCEFCVVVGWRSQSFARRLPAHTPRRLVALVAQSELRRWDNLDRRSAVGGESVLEALGHVAPTAEARTPVWPEAQPAPEDLELDGELEEEALLERQRPREGVRPNATETRTPVSCVFLWLADQSEAKVLARGSSVLVEDGDRVREKPAHKIAIGDRIILGPGSSRWSPADESTESVVRAISLSNPDLTRSAVEWRKALSRTKEDRGWTLIELQSALADWGVERGLQTLEGWLNLEQAAPIGPRNLYTELSAIWSLIGDRTTQSVDDVVSACDQLRKARRTAGRGLLKLWKGESVRLGVDEEWLEGIVERLRGEAQVHLVDAIDHGVVPEAMVGWWIPPNLVARYQGETPFSLDVDDAETRVGEDDD